MTKNKKKKNGTQLLDVKFINVKDAHTHHECMENMMTIVFFNMDENTTQHACNVLHKVHVYVCVH